MRVPLVGDLWAFIDDRLAFLEDCARSGDAVRRRMGPRRLLVLSHPDLVREVFAVIGAIVTGATAWTRLAASPTAVSAGPGRPALS